MVYVASLNKDLIFSAVRAMYTDVALHPEREYHFPTGRAACVFVGYPAAQLAELPAVAVESFAGVAYPFAANVNGYATPKRFHRDRRQLRELRCRSEEHTSELQ